VGKARKNFILEKPTRGVRGDDSKKRRPTTKFTQKLAPGTRRKKKFLNYFKTRK